MSPHTAAHDTPPPFWSTRYGIAAAVATDNAVARSLHLYGEWAEHETHLLSGLVEEGHTVCEFGGDYGAHALWMAQAVGPHGEIHVADPRRIRFQQLCANVALNQLDNVFAHHAWLGRSNGNAALSALTGSAIKRGADEKIRTLTVDSLGLDNLHLLKVNLAHALVDLLAGAAETIQQHRPLLYVRLSGLDEAEMEIAAIKELGYRVWSHVPYLYNTDNHAGIDTNIFPGMVQQNAIAAPIESRFALDESLAL